MWRSAHLIKNLSVVAVCHHQSWLCKWNTGSEPVVLFAEFWFDTHMHESLLILQRKPLIDSQATFPLHLYTFPTARKAVSGRKPRD